MTRVRLRRWHHWPRLHHLHAWRGAHANAGLTLLEVIIAIALLAALTALVLPNVSHRLDDQHFDALGDQIAEHLAFARAEAQVQGEPIVVWVEARSAANAANDASFASGDDAPLRLAFRAERLSDAARDDRAQPAKEIDAAVLGNWAELRLPEPVRASIAFTPSSSEADADQALDGGAESDAHPLESEQRFRLAIFLSDGSAAGARILRITDARDEAMTITVDPWSGAVRVERMQRVEAGVDDAQRWESFEP